MRIVWQGSRTKNWNGRFFSPGYIVNDNTILPNFDTVAREVDQYYGNTNTLSNKQISNVARFNSGYNKPNWAENLDIDDDTLFNFVNGVRKYSGTKYAVNAFRRNKKLYDDYGDNLGVSYGFGCGTYDCAVTYTDFSDDGYGGDEDALVFSVSASF